MVLLYFCGELPTICVGALKGTDFFFSHVFPPHFLTETDGTPVPVPDIRGYLTVLVRHVLTNPANAEEAELKKLLVA